MFKLIKKSKKSRARTGILKTKHGNINAPFFMPIATKGALKNLTPEELKSLGAEIILSNTYHLMIRPGAKIIKKSGGLHDFMHWQGPILTDSGGYQVFSLGEKSENKGVKITKDGVEFKDPIDGRKYFLSPEKSIEIQHDFGSDIIMAFDWCSHYPALKKQIEKSVEFTTLWAEKCLAEKQRLKNRNLVFGIIQGGVFKDLRQKSLNKLIKMDFSGYAIGGLAVGEPESKMYEILDFILPKIPKNKPRYLMGLGFPEQIVRAVKIGIDAFDCVIPTRHARHGELFVWKNKNLTSKNFYEIILISKSKFQKDLNPIDKNCQCYVCRNFSRAYLHHLYKIKEPLYQRLATIHNLKFYMDLMKKIRDLINSGKL